MTTYTHTYEVTIVSESETDNSKNLGELQRSTALSITVRRASIKAVPPEVTSMQVWRRSKVGDDATVQLVGNGLVVVDWNYGPAAGAGSILGVYGLGDFTEQFEFVK